jgi:hypothetical protein
MNIFEGARRISYVIAALIAVGFGMNVYAVFGKSHFVPAVPVSYLLSSPDSLPVRVQGCGRGNIINTKELITSNNTSVLATICFTFPEVAVPATLDEALVKYENKQRLQHTGGTIYPPDGFVINTDGQHSVSMQHFRNTYPQFIDLTDRQVTDRWHQRIYKNMPLADFEKKIELGKRSSFDLSTATPTTYDELATRFGGLNMDQVKKRVADFQIPPADNDYIDSQVRWNLLTDAGMLLLQMLATLLGFGASVWTTGWIVRGFMGIPRGQDSKPPSAGAQ